MLYRKMIEAKERKNTIYKVLVGEEEAIERRVSLHEAGLRRNTNKSLDGCCANTT